mmetsp:Transcript_46266/g.97221  ORF Transcript_46266/g.97221 Transcript_46266/m.97221 type:complete len:165 (+) Transcript_46266:155-649(+)
MSPSSVVDEDLDKVDDNSDVPSAPQCAASLSAPTAASSSSSSSAAAAVSVVARTPSAVLSRDPHRLSSAIGFSLNKVHAIRTNVAAVIIYDAHIGHGKKCRRVDGEEVTKYCINGGFDDAEADHGAMTALDLCNNFFLSSYRLWRERQFTSGLHRTTGSHATDC